MNDMREALQRQVIWNRLIALVEEQAQVLLKTAFGPITREENKGLKDLTWREAACLLPLCAMVVVMGVYPKPFLGKMSDTTGQFLAELKMRHEMSYVAKAPAAPPTAPAPPPVPAGPPGGTR